MVYYTYLLITIIYTRLQEEIGDTQIYNFYVLCFVNNITYASCKQFNFL